MLVESELVQTPVITYDYRKSQENLFLPAPCPLHPCGLNDKSLPEHDIMRLPMIYAILRNNARIDASLPLRL
ncbi:hypothetical protein [Nostoc sp.]